jgi:hypothetical protein
MRQRISTNLRWNRFIFVALGLYLPYVILTAVEPKNINVEIILVALLIAGICSLVYYLIDRAVKVEYDQHFMYVIRKKGEEKIPLEKVQRINITTIRINNRSMWQIAYNDANNLSKSVSILPRYFEYFDEFQEVVKKANEAVSVKNFSPTFD